MRLRERQKNIKILKKQILALAQEKLAKQFKPENNAASVGAKTLKSLNSGVLSRTRTRIDLVAPESKDLGDISWQDYKDFFGYSYGCCGIITLFLICILTSVSQILPSLWMTEWLK